MGEDRTVLDLSSPSSRARRFVAPVTEDQAWLNMAANLGEDSELQELKTGLIGYFSRRIALQLEAESALFERLNIAADTDDIVKWALVGKALATKEREFEALRNLKVSSKARGRPSKTGKTDGEILSEFVDSVKEKPDFAGVTDEKILGFMQDVAAHYRNLEGAPDYLRGGGLTDIVVRSDVRSLRKRVSEGRARRRVPKK